MTAKAKAASAKPGARPQPAGGASRNTARERLQEAKRSFLAKYADRPGVTGAGIGDNELIVYVDQAAAAEGLPATFARIKLRIQVAGPIRALPAS